MVVLDASIVNVALPCIQNDLHFSTSGLQGIVNAYILTFAGLLLLGGALAALPGRGMLQQPPAGRLDAPSEPAVQAVPLALERA